MVASSQTGLSFGRLGHVVTLWRFSCNKCMSCERFCRLIRGLTYLLSRVVAPLVYQLIKICFIGLTCCISVFTSLLKAVARLIPDALFHMTKLNSVPPFSLPSPPTRETQGVSPPSVYPLCLLTPSPLPFPVLLIRLVLFSRRNISQNILTCVGKLSLPMARKPIRFCWPRGGFEESCVSGICCVPEARSSWDSHPRGLCHSYSPLLSGLGSGRR